MPRPSFSKTVPANCKRRAVGTPREHMFGQVSARVLPHKYMRRWRWGSVKVQWKWGWREGRHVGQLDGTGDDIWVYDPHLIDR